jgi:hypothetical protein
VFSTTFQSIFLAIVAALLVGALVRWRRTPEAHPDYAARADVARLLGAFVLGQILVLVRSRLEPGSPVAPKPPGFWICSVALLPVVVAVLFYVRRLFGAYRQH